MKSKRLGRGLSSLVGAPVRVDVPGDSQPVSDADRARDSQATREETDASAPERVEPAGGSAGEGGGSASGGIAESRAQTGSGGVVMVDVSAVDRSAYQPRRVMDDAALDRLAESIRRSGLMQPIVVRARGGRFELIAGERRWRAAQRAGLARVPAMVREVDDREAAELALVENMQREDLNPIERSAGFRLLMDRFGLRQEEVAELVGVERSTVANLVRLVELEEEIQELITRGLLGVGHGKALLTVREGAYRVRLARAAARRSWSVRKLEQTAARETGAMGTPPRAKRAEVADLEEQLSAHLGTRVSVVVGKDKKKGRLVIEFYGIDHFEGLVGRMGFKGKL